LPIEWLEIDFGNLTYLTQVETQGRFNNGRGREYTDYYILMYTRMDKIKTNKTIWIEYKPNKREKNSTWIRANQNTYIGEIHLLGMKEEEEEKYLYLITIFQSFRSTYCSKTSSFLSC
jgi:hypothetical protein